MSYPLLRPAPLALALALALGSVAAHAQSAALPATPLAFNIQAQPLAEALNDWARQTRIQLIAQQGLVAGKRAPAIVGSLTPNQALDRLLAGTGLVATVEGQAVVIKAASVGEEGATLATVTVTADAQRDGATEGSGSYTQRGPSATATGLNLSLRETPQSVSVMTRQRMDDFKLDTLTDVMEQTPGIGIYRQGNATDFQARGTSVNLQTDGMAQVRSGWYYLTSTLFSLDDMAEIDHIDVLKGSSGLVVGKGEYGATVNMVRKRPTRSFQASVQASAGSWDSYRAQADIGGPLNEAGTLRGRLVASATDAGSFRDHEDSRSKMLFSTLEADLSPDTLLNVGFTYRQRAANGIGTTQPIQGYTRAGVKTPDRPRSFNTGAPWGGYDQNALTLFGSLEQRLGDGWTSSLKFSHQQVRMDDMFAGYLYDQDRVNYGRWTDMRNNNWTVNLDIRGPFSLLGRQHELLAGIGISRFESSVKLPLNALTLLPLEGLGTRYDQGGAYLPEPDTSSWTYGDNRFSQKQRYAYAAGRFQLSDPLQLIAGLRVTKFEERDTTPYWWNYDMNESAVYTPYAGLVYDFHPNLSAYASYASIFQPQTSQDEQGRTLKPEEGNTYEVGIKGEFFDKRLNASISHYWIKTKNTAEETGGLTPGGDTAYRSVASATRHGWELELSGELARGWQAQGSLVRQNSSLSNTSQYPEYQFKLGSTYRFDEGTLRGLTIGASTRWQDKTSVSNSAATLEQSSYAVLDLMARYQFDKQLSFSLNINNALDKHYKAGVNNFSAIGLFYTWGAPRSVNVGMRYDF